MHSHTDTLYSSGQSACWEYGLTCHAQPHTSAVSSLATGDECWEEMTVTQRTRFPDVRVSTHQCKADWCAYVCVVTLHEHTHRGTHYARPTVRLAACLPASTSPCCLYASVRVRFLFLAHLRFNVYVASISVQLLLRLPSLDLSLVWFSGSKVTRVGFTTECKMLI